MSHEDPTDITEFKVNVSDEILEDLRRRLESVRFVEPIAETKFNYGFNADYLKQVVQYWKTQFDWRRQELELNKFAHFKTQINGLKIHYIHVKPSKPAKTVVPILVKIEKNDFHFINMPLITGNPWMARFGLGVLQINSIIY